MMPASPPVLLVHSFDAHAGAQRIARSLVSVLANAGVDVRVRLGFGGRGFLSELPGVRPDVYCNHSLARKLLWPLWSLITLLPIACAAARGRTIWANTIHVLPPSMLAILLFPRRTVVHLHEVGFSRGLHWLLRIAAWRGSKIVCVSADQALRLDVAATILPNSVNLPATDPPSKKDKLIFVGTTHSKKGLALFINVSRRLAGSGLRFAAYLSDEDGRDKSVVTQALAAGVEVVFGESSPVAMYRDGFLLLMATDPGQVVETFSLIAAEAAAALVPVGGAGSTVLNEVLGEALAFNDASRDPETIAGAILTLFADPERHDQLRRSCDERRLQFSTAIYKQRVLHILGCQER